MLLLTGKKGESFYIGTNVKLTITKMELDGRGVPIVELGFDAPKHVSIDREKTRESRKKNIERIVK